MRNMYNIFYIIYIIQFAFSIPHLNSTQTVTKTERTVSRIFTSEERYLSSGGESHHSTTYTTEVKPKKRAKLSQRYATTVTTDIPPVFQPVDLTIEVPIPPNFIQPLRSIQAVEGTRVTFEGVATGEWSEKCCPCKLCE